LLTAVLLSHVASIFDCAVPLENARAIPHLFSVLASDPKQEGAQTGTEGW
jgi:hypothetical protein